MTTSFLLPNRYKLIGWIIFIPAAIFGIIISITGFEIEWLHGKVFSFFNGEILKHNQSFQFIETDLTNTLVGVLFIIGAMMVSFSKEKKEDEYIAEIRLSSLLWAVWVNFIFLLIAFLFVYGTAFFTVMVYNMFTILIIFIIRFNYILYRNSRTISDEK